jgi:predicted enzyme related to lactoylglutathione lyase
MVTVAALARCAHAPAPPPAAAGTTPDVKPGMFVWHDLLTDDVAASRGFYAGLLGWEFEDTQRLGRPFVVARSHGRRVGGLVAIPKSDERSSQWIAYLSVPDVDRAVARVVEAGGRSLVPPVNVPVGRAAIVADPQGALLGLARLAAGDPPDAGGVAAAPESEFFWMEYLADDPAAASSFYGTLAGYRTEVTDKVGDEPYQVWLTARPRAGLLRVPREGVRPTWLPYVRVADPAALAARAESLGGKVLLAPGPAVRKGTLTIVADPTGGALALQKWPIEGGHS